MVEGKALDFQDWEARCRERKQQQRDSIPKEWIIAPAKDGELNVMDVPRACGLLSAKELEITDMDDVMKILANLADGTWSSVEVTTAFYKRAIIAHQLVKPKIIKPNFRQLDFDPPSFSDELLDRNLR